jgi:hypothetical protein
MTQKITWNLVVKLADYFALLHEGDKVSNRKVCLMMSYLKCDSAGGDVHLSSPDPVFDDLGVPQDLGSRQKFEPPHHLEGPWGATEVWEGVSYTRRRSTPSLANDNREFGCKRENQRRGYR